MCEHHHEHSHVHAHKNKAFALIRICGALIIFSAGLILDLTGVEKFILFFTAYLIAGADILFTAIRNIVKGEVFDENFLMGAASIGAFAIKEYPEAVMVMILYQIGEYLQHRAVEKSRNSIKQVKFLKEIRIFLI